MSADKSLMPATDLPTTYNQEIFASSIVMDSTTTVRKVQSVNTETEISQISMTSLPSNNGPPEASIIDNSLIP